MAGNYWDSGAAATTPAQQHFKTPEVHNLGDLLDWQRAAVQEGIFKKGSSDANRAELRKWLANLSPAKAAALHLVGPLGGLVDGAKAYDKMPHVEQGVYDAELDTAFDPLTYETMDLGPVAKGAVKLLRPVTKLVSKIPGVESGVGEAKILGNASLEGITRLFNAGGEAIVKHGRTATNEALGMSNRAAAEEHELNRILQARDAATMKGLNPTQTSWVQKILHGQLPEQIVEGLYAKDPAVKRAVAERRATTDALLRMQQAPGGQVDEALSELRGKVPGIPPELQPFAGRPGPFLRTNMRADYFPARGAAKAVAKDAPEQTFNLLDTYNPHIKEQGEFNISSNRVDAFEEAFKGMLKTSARNISANRVKDELATIYGSEAAVPQAIRALFDTKIPARGSERDYKQILSSFVKGVVGLPKLGIIGTTPIHMFNILGNLLIHDPAAIPEAVTHFAKMVKAGGLGAVVGKPNEAQLFAATLPAIERGIDISTKEKGGSWLSHLPLNRWTWDWDAAAKLARSSSYVRQGHSPLDAGIRASNDLVNYRNTSPATAALRFFMPFATFAEGGAKSVLAATARNPAQVEFINRAMGGRFLGGGDPKTQTTLYQPPADVGRGPAKYIRSKTSDIVKLPIAMAARTLPGGDRFSSWLLSGRTPLGVGADILTGPVPYARDILNLVPLPGGKTVRGYAPDPPLKEGVFSSTGISLPNGPKAKPPVVPLGGGSDGNYWDSGAKPAAPGAAPAPQASTTPKGNYWDSP